MRQKLDLLQEYNVPDLTLREKEVLAHLIDGLNNREIADEMIVSVNTIKAHVSNILSKFDVNCRVKAAVKAVKMEIMESL